MTDYSAVADAVATTGMRARGAFVDDGRTVVMIGNVGGEMWPSFRSGTPDDAGAEPDPLDAWTRSMLGPIAERFGAGFVHPSDEPYRPFQRWAALADTVFPSPIGLLIHPRFGLWHAYRGAFVFDGEIAGVPAVDRGIESPCVSCLGQPCLTACPVDAFTADGYDVEACADHLRGGAEPACRVVGCHARTACPVGVEFTYGDDQMRFHMGAFAAARGV